jgi:phosphonate transport system permease protein
MRLSDQQAAPAAAFVLGGLATIVLAFFWLGISLKEMALAAPSFIGFFVKNFLPPNFKNTPAYVPLILDTVFFALAGTCISSVAALVMGFLMSSRINGAALLRIAAQFLMSILRNVPVLVWAALLVRIFGIGNMVGLIALIFGTLGLLSRSYAESADAIAVGKIEALRACGASFPQILAHGIIPEFFPAWANWTLFSFEINIRASVILGMAGAGGIGIMVQTNIRLFKYSEALSLVIIVSIIILITEFAVNQIRKRAF